LTLNGHKLQAGMAPQSDQSLLELAALEKSEFLVFDLA
jgi:hypothetical protein